MTAAGSGGYDRIVAAVRDALRCAAFGLALFVGVLLPAPAQAANSSFTVGEQSVIQVWAGNLSTITIRAWDRQNVQLDTDDESVQILRRPLQFGTPQNPLSVPIPLMTVPTRDSLTGVTNGTSALPPEDFPYASEFGRGMHDTIRIVTGARSHVTLSIPSSTAILDARIVHGAGIVTIDDYHGGTLFAGNGGGRTTLTNITSAAFVQQLNGRLDVRNSSFDRLRARGNAATFVFENVRVRQIEVTTISGPIIYDNGAFDPGLARFESTSGSIAIGVVGGAQIEARSSDGRVFNLWDRRTPTDQRSDSESSATVNGGGPIVNAVSGRGNVFLYDGSLATRRALPQEWRVVRQKIHSRAPGTTTATAPAAFERFRQLRGR